MGETQCAGRGVRDVPETRLEPRSLVDQLCSLATNRFEFGLRRAQGCERVFRSRGRRAQRGLELCASVDQLCALALERLEVGCGATKIL